MILEKKNYNISRKSQMISCLYIELFLIDHCYCCGLIYNISIVYLPPSQSNLGTILIIVIFILPYLSAFSYCVLVD